MAKGEKSENINIRVTAELKALAEAAAEEDGRSLTSYIGALIRADAAKRGVKGKRALDASTPRGRAIIRKRIAALGD